MKQQLQTSTLGSGSGSITFYDSSRAPLKADEYTLTVKQKLTLPAEFAPVDPYEVTRSLTVDGPRWELSPSDVQSTFPPAQQQAAGFAEALPHVVLGRDIPWARPISPSAPEDDTPWLALLVVHQAEASKVQGPTTTTVATLLSPPSGIVAPSLSGLSQDELSRSLQMLTVDLDFWKSVIPSRAELTLLAHAREVETSQKVTGLAQGHWSLVIANRLPDSDANAARTTTCYLVSVEGHADHLAGSSVSGSGIAMAVLAMWSFSVSAFPGDFLSLLQNIGKAGQDQVLKMPTLRAKSDDSTGAAHAGRAIELGFVPLQNTMREGEITTSWYRSPFTPYPSRVDPLVTSYTVSDHAIRYDQRFGLFDHTYACAWQIGRLLALSDPALTQAVLVLRQAAARKVQDAVTDEIVQGKLDSGSTSPSGAAARSAALRDSATTLGPNASAARARLQASSLIASRLSQVATPQSLAPKRSRRARQLQRASSPLPAPESFAHKLSQGDDPLQALLDHLGIREAGR